MWTDLSTLSKIYYDGLMHDIVPFWVRHAVDQQYGGFITSLDRDGTILDTDKSVWQQARFTWLLAKLCNEVQRRGEWLELAVHGANFIEQYCYDPSDGRLWFQLDRNGQPLRKRRYAFSESFAAIAFGELARATSSDHYATLAVKAFRTFVNHRTSTNASSPSSASKYTDTRPTRGIGVPMITINTAQELRHSIGFEEAEQWIDGAIEDIRRYHVHEDIACVVETVAVDGGLLNHYDGRTLNPGHAIEAAWFIMAEGRFRGDRDLIELGCKMLDWMWERGWDKEHGGILYFTSIDGKPLQEYWHEMKFWWPHNETIIATLMAYMLTGDTKYAEWHRQVHCWAYKHFPDLENGEWFGYLNRDGSVNNRCKGNHWKGPFHLPRMQLICWQLLNCTQPT